MDSQLNYLIAQQRQAELVSRAEQARLANRRTCRRIGAVPTLESRPARRDASAPGCRHANEHHTHTFQGVAPGDPS